MAIYSKHNYKLSMNYYLQVSNYEYGDHAILRGYVF
jgi:hypothetical protein